MALREARSASGEVGHTGTDGSDPWERLRRYGAIRGSAAENISYGGATGRDVVLQLLIDDGVRDRGHRDNMFDPLFHVVGVSCGPHAEYEVMCVLVYAQGFDE